MRRVSETMVIKVQGALRHEQTKVVFPFSVLKIHGEMLVNTSFSRSHGRMPNEHTQLVLDIVSFQLRNLATA